MRSRVLEERRKRVNPETRESVALSFRIVDRIHEVLQEKGLKQKDLALKLGIFRPLHPFEVGLDAIGNRVNFRGVIPLFQFIAHKFRRHMDVAELVVGFIAEDFVNQIVGPFHFAHQKR